MSKGVSEPAGEPAAHRELGQSPLNDIASLEIGKVLDSLPYYVLLVDADHHISFANKPARAALGKTMEELQGGYCPRIVHGLDHPYPGCPLEAAVKGIEFEREHFDTATGRWSLLTAYPTGIRNGAGSELYYHSVQDITDKKHAQMEREATEEKFKNLFDGSIDIIFIIDAEGRLLELNKAGFAFLRLTSNAELAKFDLFRDLGFSRPAWRRFCRHIMVKGSVEDYELELKHGDGAPALILVSANAMIDECNRLTVVRGIARDQTRHRMLEQQLNQAQRLESVGRMAGGVAHDFNNCLAAIEGAISLALDEIPQNDQSRELLEEALKSCSQAAGVSRELMLFSRNHKIELKPLNINSAIQAIMTMLARVVGSRTPVTTCLADDAWPVVADEVHIGQVILNLAINARDAIGEAAGTITIITENVELDSDAADGHPQAQAGRYLRLVVADNGCGIDPQIIAKIFDPFFTTKALDKGNGLGLSVVHGIVGQHNGWIEVESQPGAGTSFLIYIPAIHRTAGENSKSQNSTEPSGGDTRRILIVEDEASVRGIARRILESLGHAVTTAGTASEALKAFEASDGSFDLVFCDLILPDMNGATLAHIFMERDAGLRVLLTSGNLYSINQSDLDDERLSTIEKPYGSEDLIARIRELLG